MLSWAKAGWVRSLVVGLATALLGLLIIVLPLGQDFEEEVGLPWLFWVRGPIAPPEGVAVAAINSGTGQRLGIAKLPRDWPRTVHAGVVESLVDRDAAVMVFDMDFNRPRPGTEDAEFAAAVAEAHRVVLFERLIGKRQPLQGTDGVPAGFTWVEERLEPAPPLADAARALAPFVLPKTGQAAFQFWTFKPSGGDVPTTVATALQLYALPVYQRWLELLRASHASAVEKLPASVDDLGSAEDVRALMGWLREMFMADPGLAGRARALLGPARADADPTTRMLTALIGLYGGERARYLSFYGPPGTVRTVPYENLIQAGQERFLPLAAVDGAIGALAGRAVFVGYSDLYEPDQPDRFYTVFTGSDGIDLSGVEIMATAFANLLHQQTLRRVEGLPSAGLLLGFGLAIGVIASILPALYAIPVVLLTAGGTGLGAQLAFDGQHLWLPVATPFLVQLPLALLLGLMSQYLLGRRRQQQMSQAMSYYLPAHVLKDMTEGTIDPGSVDKVVEGVCFATDMSGFSTLAEQRTPAELAIFMNAYFDALASALKRHGVDVTEFHADTIMCVWLTAQRAAAKRRDAVLAAIDAVAATEAFARGQGGIDLNPRIGMQDGSFYLGHTGGGGRLSYSILGDPANTAARLESLNKHLGTHILGADSVVEGLEEELLMRPLGRFQLKGRAEATGLAEVLLPRAQASARQLDLCARFAEALQLFREHRWPAAGAAFEALLGDWPDDGPSKFYASVCRDRQADPGMDDDPDLIRMDMK